MTDTWVQPNKTWSNILS